MSVDALLALAVALLLVSVLSLRLAQRWGAPAMLLLVGIGVLAGSSGPGGIVFGDYKLAYEVGLVCLAIIVFTGGYETDFRSFRRALAPAALLATLGVFIKVGIVGAGLHFLVGLGYTESFLLGAIIAPTDAAAVFSVLKGKGLRPRIASILEAESGSNDPVSIYLTVAFSAAAVQGQLDAGSALGGMVMQLAIGGVLGLVAGRALVWLIRRLPPSDAPGLFPLLALIGGLGVYGAINLVHGNGILAAYCAGLVVGGAQLPYRRNVAQLLDSLSWFAQLVVFLMLGLLVFPDALSESLPIALAASALAIVARPASILATALILRLFGTRFSRGELFLLSWGGLKGAVPIILAIVPLLMGHPAGEAFFNVAFIVVILTTTLQGLTLIPLARRLGLLDGDAPTPPIAIDLQGLVTDDAAVVDIRLTVDDACVGRRLEALRLPDKVAIVGVVRDGTMLAARGSVELRHDDHLFVLFTGNHENDDVRQLINDALVSPPPAHADAQLNPVGRPPLPEEA